MAEFFCRRITREILQNAFKNADFDAKSAKIQIVSYDLQNVNKKIDN
jgi:hypothetical protein